MSLEDKAIDLVTQAPLVFIIVYFLGRKIDALERSIERLHDAIVHKEPKT